MPELRDLFPSGDNSPTLDVDRLRRRTTALRRRRVLSAGAAAVVVLAGASALGATGMRGGESDKLIPPVAAPSATAPQRTATPTSSATPTSPSPSERSTATPSPTSVLETTPPSATRLPSSAAPGTTATPTPDQPSPAFPANADPDYADATGGPFTVIAVRSSQQVGYDRVVYEFYGAGPGGPGWRAQYRDTAIQEFTGDDLRVKGNAVLELFFTGMANQDSEGHPQYSGRQTPGDTQVVREVVTAGTWEAESQHFIGVDRRAPFRVFRLSNPARVVVDIRTDQ